MSRGAKIAIGVAVVLAVGAAIFFYLQKNNQNQTDQQVAIDDQSNGDIYAPDTTITPDETGSLDQASITPTSVTIVSQTTPAAGKTTTPKASTSKTAVAKIAASVTPFPGSGPLDWTRNKGIDRQALLDNVAARDVSAAQISGLSDSWSNPVEKFAYDSLDFFDKVVLGGLNSLSCMLSLTMLHENVNANLQSEYVNGECRIIDR